MEQARQQQGSRFGSFGGGSGSFGNASSRRTSLFGEVITGDIQNQHNITPYRGREFPDLEGILPNRSEFQQEDTESPIMAPSRELTKLKSANANLKNQITEADAKIKAQDKQIKSRDKLVKDSRPN